MGFMKLLYVIGARPNFIKIAPLMNRFRSYSKVKQVLVHTGQHYDYNLSRIFLEELSIQEPDIFLQVGSHSRSRQIDLIAKKLRTQLRKQSPDLVIVVGDVNSTLAGAICAYKLNIPVAHIEAGLRSFDLSMPEETNRILTDLVSRYLFTSCKEANMNLLNEGADRRKIYFVGNIMIDTLKSYLKMSEQAKILSAMQLRKKHYCLMTLHRPENVDDSLVLGHVLWVLQKIQKRIKVIWPAHPRTRKMIKKSRLKSKIDRMRGLHFCEPVGYLDFIRLMQNARFVLTDSGGVQEETTFLKVPCLTLRENTERPITVTHGTNLVIGRDPKQIIKEVDNLLAGYVKKVKPIKLWDGNTAGRIAEVLLKNI